MAQTEHLHTGHRERLFERYANSGIDSFSDVELLELVLTFAIPRKDTNPIAHRLLAQFGSLRTVFEAPLLSLESVEGMTKRAATLLQMYPGVWKRYENCLQRETVFFRTTEACGDYLEPFFRGLRDEHVWLLCLDAKCKLLDCREISHGTVNFATLPIRRVVETALAVNASSVVIAHNHPSGIALPSKEDVELTKQLQTALQSVDVLLADHIVVAEGDYVSMRDSCLL